LQERGSGKNPWTKQGRVPVEQNTYSINYKEEPRQVPKE